MEESVGRAQKGGSAKRLVIDILVISFGIMVSSLGTAIFYASNLGSSPMATFSDGIHNILSISYGAANTLANGILLILLFFIKRNYINVGTVLCVFLIGPFVNFFNKILSVYPIEQLALYYKVIFVVIGTALMGIGLGLYVAVERGYGPLEAIVKLLCEEKGLSYTKAKVAQDIILVALGIILSAKWGLGTVIAAVLTGPILQKSIQFFKPIYKKLD